MAMLNAKLNITYSTVGQHYFDGLVDSGGGGGGQEGGNPGVLGAGGLWEVGEEGAGGGIS